MIFTSSSLTMCPKIIYSIFRSHYSFSLSPAMAEINLIATVACVEALHHIELVIEYFKLIKNGKPLRIKLGLFVETIVDPSKLTDVEINDFVKDFDINFFKNSENYDMKQKISAAILRMHCGDVFCSKLIQIPLKEFVISSAMRTLYDILIPYYKPVVIEICSSKKSHRTSQVNNFNNLTTEQFEIIKNTKMQQKRKMSKFQIWSVKNEYIQWINNIINHSVDDKDKIIVNSETINGEINNGEINYSEINKHVDLTFDWNAEIIDNADTMFDLEDIDCSNYFSSFCG